PTTIPITRPPNTPIPTPTDYSSSIITIRVHNDDVYPNFILDDIYYSGNGSSYAQTLPGPYIAPSNDYTAPSVPCNSANANYNLAILEMETPNGNYVEKS